jgi:hypothetical protein
MKLRLALVATYRAYVSLSVGFPSGFRFLGNPTSTPLAVDTCSEPQPISASLNTGYPVPEIRFTSL